MTPWGLLQARTSADGTSPLITMYDDATGERVELSAVSFANWVAKTANLLVDDLDVEPGDTVTLDLPAHWQSFVLGFAVCAAGGVIGAGGRIRAVLEGASADADTLVLSLRPMGAGLAAPGTGVDYAGEVRLHGDYFPGGDGASVEPPVISFAAGSRVLTASASLATAFDTMLAALACGGSLVLVRNEELTAREHRVATEKVTQTV